MTPFARITVAALVLAVPVLAQKKPSFSGRWVVVSPKEGVGKEQIVTQDDKTLTTERVTTGDSHKMVYQLDGVERRLAVPSHGTDVTLLAKASWDAGRIVITRDESYSSGQRIRSVETWSIDEQGRLVIDSSETGPRGEAGPAMKVIYAKKK